MLIQRVGDNRPGIASATRWQAVAVSTDETPLAIWGNGAAASKAHRRQDVVLRTAGPWSRSVMALLKHLEAAGFEGAPVPSVTVSTPMAGKRSPICRDNAASQRPGMTRPLAPLAPPAPLS